MSAGGIAQRLTGGDWSALTSSRPRPRAARWPRAAALVVFAGMAVAAWWPVLGHTLLAASPAVTVGCVLVAGRGRPRFGAAALVLWIPLALLLAGLPLSIWRPADLGASVHALSQGWHTLGLAHRATTATDRWAVSAALLAFGGSWLMAGFVATQRGRAASGLAYLLGVVPFVSAVALGGATDRAWHGAALLAATLLWMTRGRPVLAVVGTAVVAGVALGGSLAIGPHHRWLAFGPQQPAFNTLDTDQTYGPLEDRRTGATMLEVTAAQPALWRMQVFDRFDGGGFQISRFGANTLPQPKARSVTTKVKVVNLRNHLIVSAGQVTSVQSSLAHRQVFGEGTELAPGPEKGTTYTVKSEVVDATTAELEQVKIPPMNMYDEYTRVSSPQPSQVFAGNLPPRFRSSPPEAIYDIAHRLAAGTDSELGVVKRVEAYLDDPNRFTYTTDVAPASSQPIAQFLLSSHRGYCQHFAGAAALLLRLAGVPTRVVAGFATGQSTGNDTYKVTDEDAHAWIEVYFEGYGWVPFNPTPSAAEAIVPASLDRFAPPQKVSAVGSAALPGALVVVVAAVGGGWWWMRRRRRILGVRPRGAAQLSDLLARLVPGPVAPGMTLTRLQPQFAAIGPSVAGLAARVERERFAAAHDAEPARRPRLTVWRALRRDRGWLRATLMLVRRR